MDKFLKTLRNRDFLLIFSIVLGLAWGDGAKVAEKAVLPVLAPSGIPGGWVSAARIQRFITGP